MTGQLTPVVLLPTKMQPALIALDAAMRERKHLMEAAVMDAVTPGFDRKPPLLDLVIVGGAAIVMIDVLAIEPATVVGGGVGVKLLFLSRVAVLLILATWRLRRSGRGWHNVGLCRPQVVRCVAAIILGLIAIAAAVGIFGTLMAHAGYARANYSVFAPLRSNLLEYLFWVGPVTIGSAAFGEELIFRGFLRDAFERLFAGTGQATFLAIAVQAVIFGMLHAYQGFAGMMTAGIIGLVLGFVWLGSKRNLWPGIVIHILLDGSAMTAIYLGLPVA